MGFIYTYTIQGETVAKKNSKQIFVNKKTGKPFISSSQNFTTWHKGALLQLLKQGVPTKPIDKPCLIHLCFKHGDNRRRDSDNGTSSILDLLVDAKILSDDSWQIVHDIGIKNEYEKNAACCRIVIQEL